MTDQHPQTPLYRWLIRLLPLGALVTVAAFALGTWAMVANMNRNEKTTNELRRQNDQQNLTLRLLCNRGYLEAFALEVIAANEPDPVARSQIQGVREAIVAGLVERGSPCAKP